MKRLSIALVVFCFAASTHAATLGITPSNPTPVFGDLVTFTIEGDSEGAASNGVFGRLLFDPGVFSPVSTTQSQLTSFGGVLPWLLGTISCGTGYCDAFNQVGEIVPYPVDNLLTSLIVLQVIANPAGTVVQWETNILTGFQLQFFGLTDAPEYTFIPEPATASLLGLALVGLGAIRRRRRA